MANSRKRRFGVQVIVGPEVDQFFRGELMWRYVAGLPVERAAVDHLRIKESSL